MHHHSRYNAIQIFILNHKHKYRTIENILSSMISNITIRLLLQSAYPVSRGLQQDCFYDIRG